MTESTRPSTTNAFAVTAIELYCSLKHADTFKLYRLCEFGEAAVQPGRCSRSELPADTDAVSSERLAGIGLKGPFA
jgi:hypothetical protein